MKAKTFSSFVILLLLTIGCDAQGPKKTPSNAPAQNNIAEPWDYMDPRNALTDETGKIGGNITRKITVTNAPSREQKLQSDKLIAINSFGGICTFDFFSDLLRTSDFKYSFVTNDSFGRDFLPESALAQFLDVKKLSPEFNAVRTFRAPHPDMTRPHIDVVTASNKIIRLKISAFLMHQKVGSDQERLKSFVEVIRLVESMTATLEFHKFADWVIEALRKCEGKKRFRDSKDCGGFRCVFIYANSGEEEIVLNLVDDELDAYRKHFESSQTRAP